MGRNESHAVLALDEVIHRRTVRGRLPAAAIASAATASLLLGACSDDGTSMTTTTAEVRRLPVYDATGFEPVASAGEGTRPDRENGGIPGFSQVMRAYDMVLSRTHTMRRRGS